MNKIEKTNKLIEKSGSTYNDNTALRVAVNLIPGVGGALDVLISSRGPDINFQRNLKLVESFEKEIKKVKEENINKDYLESEECYDLVLKIFENSSKTRLDSKRDNFAKLFSQLITKKITIDKSEIYLYILNDLNEIDLILLRKIFGNQPIDVFKLKFQNLKELNWDFISDLLEENEFMILSKLEKLGLIKEYTGTAYDYTGGTYYYTKLCKNFLSFL